MPKTKPERVDAVVIGIRRVPPTLNNPQGIMTLLTNFVEDNEWKSGTSYPVGPNLYQLDFTNGEGVSGTAYASIYSATAH